MRRLKTYRLIFTDTRYMRIEFRAKSARAAIEAAKNLYLHSDPLDDRFMALGGEAFHDVDAREVKP